MPSPGSALRHAAQPLLNHPTGSRGQETLSKWRQGWCQRETHRSCDLAGTLHVKRTQEASSNTKTAKGLTLALKPPELRSRIEGPDFPFRSTLGPLISFLFCSFAVLSLSISDVIDGVLAPFSHPPRQLQSSLF